MASAFLGVCIMKSPAKLPSILGYTCFPSPTDVLNLSPQLGVCSKLIIQQLQEIFVEEASWKESAYSIHMQMALANQTQREESAKSEIQEEHEKCAKALPEYQYSQYLLCLYMSYCSDWNTVIPCYSSRSVALERSPFPLIVWWHREARIRHMLVKTIFIESCRFLCPSFFVARVNHFPINSFSSWCFHMFSLYFGSRLHVSFSPCDHTFQTPKDISHPGFQQPLHLVTHFHCFQETAKIFPPLPPFPGTATAGAVPWLQWARKIPRLQDLEASSQDSCDHYESQRNGWLHRSLRHFMKKGTSRYKSHQLLPISKVYQSPLQKVIRLDKLGTFKKKGKVETAGLSHHITTQKPRLALNPVAFIAAGHRGAPTCDTSEAWCSWRRIYTHQSQMQLVNFLKIRDSWNSNSNEIVAFYTLNPQEVDFFVALVWPSRLTHRTWSAWRLRQIDGVPFTWKNNSWWDRWTYAGESGNVWSIR